MSKKQLFLRTLCTLLALAFALSGCAPAPRSIAETVWSYCSGKDEFVVNDSYCVGNGIFLVVTEDFVVESTIESGHIVTTSIVETGECFPEKDDDHAAFAAALKTYINPSGTLLLLRTKKSACIYDVAAKAVYKLNYDGDLSKLYGFVNDSALLSLTGESATVKLNNSLSIKVCSKSISSDDILASSGQRVFVLGAGGVYSLTFDDAGEIVRNFDTLTTKPVYSNNLCAVFSEPSGKRILNLATEEITDVGATVSGRIRKTNVAFATDKYLVTKSSRNEYSLYSLADDTKLELPRVTPERFVSTDNTIAFVDTDGASYILSGQLCEKARSTELSPPNGTTFIITHKAGVQYLIYGFDAVGNVYEYTLDLLGR